MRCNQNPVMLASWFDGELPSNEAVVVQHHVKSCPHCAVEIAELARLQRSLRAARHHFAPSDDFRKRMQQQFAPRPRPRMLRVVPLSIALAAMLLIAIGWMQYSRRADIFADTFTEVADLHVNTLASANPLDVISTDRHTVKPWFQGRIPFSFNVPELAGTEFTLLGGRFIYLHQQPGAQLIVSMGQHKISVLIFQESSELARALSGASGVRFHNSFKIETWRSQGLRFLVIGDTEPTEIEKLAQSLKQANQ
jgi:anti-sigma factor RsiW